MEINKYGKIIQNVYNRNIKTDPKIKPLPNDSFECTKKTSFKSNNNMEDIILELTKTIKSLTNNPDFKYPKEYTDFLLNSKVKTSEWTFFTANFIKQTMDRIPQRCNVTNLVPIAMKKNSDMLACLDISKDKFGNIVNIDPYDIHGNYIKSRFNNFNEWLDMFRDKDHQYYVDLSKDISYALRHNPEECGITLDKEGYTTIDELLDYLNSTGKHGEVEEEDLEKITTMFEKKRHEIKDGKIRAYYGHSFEEKIEKTPVEPPKVLYHGTSHEAAEKILKEGIKPNGRQYVHLSANTDIAKDVGQRKDKKPVILQINTQKANEDGIPFYLGNENIWLADYIPPQYISIVNYEKK